MLFGILHVHLTYNTKWQLSLNGNAGWGWKLNGPPARTEVVGGTSPHDMKCLVNIYKGLMLFMQWSWITWVFRETEVGGYWFWCILERIYTSEGFNCVNSKKEQLERTRWEHGSRWLCSCNVFLGMFELELYNGMNNWSVPTSTAYLIII